MPWVVLRIAMSLGIALSLAQPSLASDIVCETSFQSKVSECVDAASGSTDCSAYSRGRSKGERLICDYAMLANGYDRIYEDQQKLLRQGKISEAEVEAWRAKRDACDTVSCLDGLFAEWDQRADRRNMPIAPATISGTPPTVQKTPEVEAFAVRPIDAYPSRQLPASTEPQAEASTTSLETPAPPEPDSREGYSSVQPATAPSTPRDSSALGNLVWVGFIGIVIAQVLTPKRDRRFKTGYKNNRTVPTAVPILYGLSVVAVLLGFLAT